MVEKSVVIRNRLGLHARPAAMFARVASGFQSRIWVRKGELEVNGKSVMGLILLAAECGSEICMGADGPDEKEAMAQLNSLFDRSFDEE